MKKFLWAIGLVSFLLAATPAVASNLLPLAAIDTGDKLCNGVGYSASWTSTYPTTVYIHRIKTWWLVGGNLTPQIEGWNWLANLAANQIYAAWGGEALWTRNDEGKIWDFKADGDSIPVPPGATITLGAACANYTPSGAPAVARGIAYLWIYDAP